MGLIHKTHKLLIVYLIVNHKNISAFVFFSVFFFLSVLVRLFPYANQMNRIPHKIYKHLRYTQKQKVCTCHEPHIGFS
uniref:Uncharacterized protein n=1 Tax=Anguilla anguilla TaxID=7936 RepID=A0A0E9XU85_ANGAN